ncbi:MAG: hypothetical protein C5B50_15465 [Verrucomicrobia bacterium]|nr:MAG: hypothetical protein C5B50_15465 [Verrucomicrobiota bacterium]
MRLTNQKTTRAFTLTDLLLIIAVLLTAVVALSMLLPSGTDAKVARRISCLNNLRQISKSFRTLLIDAGPGEYPTSVPATAGGPPGGDPTISAMCDKGRGEDAAKLLYQVFLVMSNELNTPKVAYCPAEYAASHSNATTFAAVAPPGSGQIPFGRNASANYQVSYFVNAQANDAYPKAFLVGDHAMGNEANGDPTVLRPAPYAYGAYGGSAGCFILGGMAAGGVSTNKPTASWMSGAQHGKCGNVCLADGSAATFDISNLRKALAHTEDPHNNQFLFPPTD